MLVYSLADFLRSVAINRHKKFLLFLGAGASITSGIPSVEKCILDLKKKIFISHNPSARESHLPLGLNFAQEKIQRFLVENNIFPSSGESDYSYYIRTCYPSAKDRQLFFKDLIHGKSPSYGYKLIPLLAENKLIDSIWTTNFDGLTARAAASSAQIRISEIGHDCIDRLNAPHDERELKCVSLHGDYRYDLLKNTDSELQDSENKLLDKFVQYAQNYSIIICGYSGRDECIMQSLKKAYCNQSNHSIYWCGYGDPEYQVESFLTEISKSGSEAFYVKTNGFDDLIYQITQQCLPEEAKNQIEEIVTERITQHEYTGFQLPCYQPNLWIKSNSYPIELPKTCWKVEVTNKEFITWKKCKELCFRKKVAMVPFNSAIYALGDIGEIKSLLEDATILSINTVPLDISFSDTNEGPLQNLVTSAFLKAIALKRNKDLRTDTRRTIWKKETFYPENKWKKRTSIYSFHQAVEICISKRFNQTVVVITPTVKIHEDVDQYTRSAEINKILGWQHNAKFNEDLKKWETILFKDKEYSFFLPGEENQQFRILNNAKPIGCGIYKKSLHGKYSAIGYKTSSNGIILEEPQLVFSPVDKHKSNISPIIGLSEFSPYSLAFTNVNPIPSIKIAIITPEGNEEDRLLAFLKSSNSKQPSEKDYVIEFKGFESIYKIPLCIPEKGSHLIEHVQGNNNPKKLGEDICRATERLKSKDSFDILLIYIPSQWGYPIKIDRPNDYFDLHDYIKAFCAQKGISSQFIAGKSIDDISQKSRIWWWLSLALYTKAGYVPWVLDNLDDSVAYIGIGYSINKSSHQNDITIGCSHIYNRRGEGLTFRLRQLESPFFDRKRNPYMSKDDARRMGEGIIQLFFEQNKALPERVVIHKLTPFRKDEIEGLRLGLQNISNIDLIEINIDNDLKFIASSRKNTGIEVNNYPMERGALLIDSSSKAYVWVHGSMLMPFGTYYQGKRRIPSPIVVKRHYGNTGIDILAQEILGLSKMDYNSLDVYTPLPCTVLTAKRIARIGQLIPINEKRSFDYRLFM